MYENDHRRACCALHLQILLACGGKVELAWESLLLRMLNGSSAAFRQYLDADVLTRFAAVLLRCVLGCDLAVANLPCFASAKRTGACCKRGTQAA
jgi:hypothetical protein